MTAIEPDVRDVYQRLLEAWNRRDAEAYGALFAVDAAMIGFDGSQVLGAEVADHLGAIFENHPTATYVAKVMQVRAVGRDGVMLRAIAGMVPPGRPELNSALNAVQTLIAERHDDRWQIVLFQNTPAQYHGRPDLSEQHTAELQPLAATGTAMA